MQSEVRVRCPASAAIFGANDVPPVPHPSQRVLCVASDALEAPDKAWVTDITYIRTHEGFAYLAVVIDLYSRRVIGWSMQSRQTTDVVVQALVMAVWRRKPNEKVLAHSDQGPQFTSMDWVSFLKHHNLVHSMSRRGNCHDNAVAESFFNLLTRER
jgi:putative transposase